MAGPSVGQFSRPRRGVPAARAAVFLALLAVALLGAAPAALATVTPQPQPVIKADRILVLKAARRLELLKDGVVLKTFRIMLGAHPFGPKHFQGDDRTPEGVYVIDGRLPHSAYHLALHISYPNDADRAYAAALGRDPGGSIELHGLPNWYRWPKPVGYVKDWTDGCISVSDRAIEEIWAAVDDGTPIEIRP